MTLQLLKSRQVPFYKVNYLKQNKKFVDAWIEIHKDELMADWQLAINGESVFKIDPLK